MKLLRRWLVTGGQMGEVPTWYRIQKAAQYLGVAPWELEVRPWSYTLRAEAAQEAEAWAASEQKTGGHRSVGDG